jgi:polysaccharide pyruvyl transferase WcaK-like protein
MTAIPVDEVSAIPDDLSVTSNAPRPSIGVLYPSGWGNLGDEAILQVTFAAIRRRWPQASVRAFTLHPARTAANHGVAAEPLSGINRYLFGAPLGEGPFLVRATRALARRTADVRLIGRALNLFSDAVATVVFETTSVVRAWRWLQTADVVIASGGGQLDAVWGGAWGQPYALARWAWLARRAGVPFVLQSVGFGRAQSWLSRRFLRYAVDTANYCSVRDSGSKVMTRGLGVKRDLKVVPDLAFGLTPPNPLPIRRPGYDIGLSPMVYLRPGSWPIADSEGYRRLVKLWSEIVAHLVSRGDRVHLFVSNPGDMQTVNEVVDCLDAETRTRCTITCPQTPNQLLDFYRGVDAVISSRLHGVLLAIVSGRPVLGLSHERKVAAAMQDAGVSDFCLDLATSEAHHVVALLDRMIIELDTCAERLNMYSRSARSLIREQQELMPRFLKVGQ